jgi:chromosome segregation ATPase
MEKHIDAICYNRSVLEERNKRQAKEIDSLRDKNAGLFAANKHLEAALELVEDHKLFIEGRLTAARDEICQLKFSTKDNKRIMDGLNEALREKKASLEADNKELKARIRKLKQPMLGVYGGLGPKVEPKIVITPKTTEEDAVQQIKAFFEDTYYNG